MECFNKAEALDAAFITVSGIDHPRFFFDFTVKEKVCAATLSVTGLGLYRAFINGARVGGDYLTPGFNDYDAYLRYESYDVTALLSEQNCIEVLLGDGWYKGRFGMTPAKNIFGERYLLAARLTIRLSGGGEQVFCTDENWRATHSHILSSSIYDGEQRDDTTVLGEPVPCEIAVADYLTVPAFSPPVRCMDTLKPALMVSPKGETILDFGQNMVGVVRFINRLPRGEKIRLQFGEILQDGCFYRDNLRSAKAEYVYTSDGTEKPVEPLFTFYGFRYALVDGPRAVDPVDFTGLVLYSDLPTVFEISTDNPKIDRLVQNAYWGQRGNFLDIPSDCPQRDERLAWTGDAQVFVNTACYHMDCRDFYRKYLVDLRADQTRYCGGDIPMYSPCLKQGGGGGALWADAAMIIPWQVYQNYGDKARLLEAYPLMRDYVETLIRRDEEQGGTHVFDTGFTFGDWLAQDGSSPSSFKGGTDESFIRTVCYQHSVHLAALAAHELGKPKDAARYEALAARTRAAIQHEFFSASGRLCVDTQTGYTLALHYDLCPDRDKAIAGFRTRMKKDLLKLTTGFAGTPLLLPTLFDCGMDEEAYRLLYYEGCPGWLYAVNLGATTIWERWNSVLPDGSMNPMGMNSLNHYSYGSVCEAIYSRIAGLRLAAPGWVRAEIAPHPNYRMKHIALAFRSPAGKWQVSWNIDAEGLFSLRLTVPEGANAIVRLPAHPENAVHELSGGTHSYRYVPTVDYWHPFSADSPTVDILTNASARTVLKEKLPHILDMISAGGEEFAADSLREVAMRFSDASADVALADALLCAVKV